jgi:SWI/SNF-related matrix-associated actin-dependent regulator of chromatin subfamily A-like protein 1
MAPTEMRPPLKAHQKSMVEYALKNPYAILAADPGLGKSRVAIEAHKKKGGNCLIVCPGYLVLNWVKELKNWGDEGAEIVAIRTGKQIYDVCDADYIVVSYDLVQKAEHFFEWADVVVLDEAHNIKSMKAKRTTFIHKNIYENSVPSVWLLTGTPIKNRVQELYSLLALCFYNPHTADSQFLVTYPSEIDFADKFSYREQYTIEIRNKLVTIMKWHGIRNIDELKTWLTGKYLRIKSEDVLDLPPLTYKSMLISDVPDQELLGAFEKFFNEADNSSVAPNIKAMAALKKAPFTVKYAKDLLEEVGSVLIYSDHVEASEEIARAFNVPAINGKMPAHRRIQLAKDFQAGVGNVLVATIKSLSEGVDLTRASHIIFNDLSWVPGDMKQVSYRIQRIGQKSHCTIHRILGSPQDEYIMNTLDEKMATIEKAT